MKRRLGVGVVGVGFGARVLVPAFRADPRCEVVAVCAGTRARAEDAGRRLGIAQAYGGWRQLLADPAVDLVAIAAPPAAQAVVAAAAAEAGKHLFCEKPLAATAEQAARLCEAAQRAGIVHAIDFEFPELDAWQQARRLLSQGTVGALRHGVISWQVETPMRDDGPRSWKQEVSEGGGVLNLLGSHVFYNVEWLCGPISRVSAWLDHPRGGRPSTAEHTAMLCLQLADGTGVAVVLSNATVAGPGHRLELYGSEGSLVLDNAMTDSITGFALWHRTRQAATLVRSPAARPPLDADDCVPAVSRLIQRFLTAIEQGMPMSPSFHEGARIQRVIEAARRSHAEGRWCGVDALVEDAAGVR